jgi:hypothetical protein
MRNAISYTNALRELLGAQDDVIFVDCVRLLVNSPKSLILQHDGFIFLGWVTMWSAKQSQGRSSQTPRPDFKDRR